MGRRFAIAAAVVIALVAGSSARADVVLGSFAFEGTGNTSAAIEWEPFLSYTDPDVEGATYMGNVTMDLIDLINGTIEELAGDLPGFNALATNGITNGIHVGFKTIGGTGDADLTDEFTLLSGGSSLAPGVGLPDFAGYTITRIQVQVTSFATGVDGDFNVGFQFTVLGDAAVPEPASLGMLSLSGAALLLRRRKR